MKSKIVRIPCTRGFLITSLAVTASLRASDLYWDIDGATAGAGGTAPAGTWSTSNANWSTDLSGASATQNWTNGDSAIFSAGSNATGQFNVTNSGVTVDNLTQQEGRIRLINGTLTLADTSMTIDTQTRVSADYDIRIDSVIANSGAGASSVTKTGAGILMLTGSNTFSGGFSLNAGSVFVENQNNAFGSGTLTLAGGNLAKSWGGGVITFGNAVNVTGTTNVAVVQGNAGDILFNGAVTGSGTFQVSNAAVNGFGVQAASIRVAGDISGFTGTFSHTAGNNRLRFGGNVGAATLTTVDASSTRFFTAGSTTVGNPIDMADNRYGTFKMGELAGTGGIVRGGWTDGAGNNTTFEIGALNTASRFAGSLQDNLRGAGGLSALNKIGTGVLELALAGGNSYSGGTIVTAGALLAGNTTGSATGSGSVTVNGGRLAGTGVIAPTGVNGINVTSGVIAPGGAVSATTGGSFSPTIGNLTFNLGGTTGTIAIGTGAGFEFALGSAGGSLASAGTSDLVTLLGASAADFTFNGNTIDFGGTGEAGFYKLFNTSLDETTWTGLSFDGSTGLVSAGLNTSNLAAGRSGQFIIGTASNGGDAGDIYLQVAVPEPGAAMLGGVGLLVLLRRRRTGTP